MRQSANLWRIVMRRLSVGSTGLTVEDVGVLLWLPLPCIRWLLLSSSHGAIRRIERTERFRLDAAERIQHLGVHGCQVELGLKRA